MVELKETEFDTIGFVDGTTLIIGNSESTYKFLQNLNVYKANLHKRGYTFKPLLRIDEQTALVKVIPR